MLAVFYQKPALSAHARLKALGVGLHTQAGQSCVCRSQAWDAKIVTSAWWVHHDQVRRYEHLALMS